MLLTIIVILMLFLKGCTSIFHEHKFIINELLPTCTEQGYIEEVCECGEKNILDYTNPLHHTYGEWETINPSIMTSEGTKQKTIRLRCAKLTPLESKCQMELLHGPKRKE